jgi:tetraacyldisaccharide 4'-kinase
LSQLYRLMAALHRAVYRWGWAAIERPSVPVVVVGNWIAGGAGKTPSLLMVLTLLDRWGWKAGVVSRGYGRRSQGVQVAHPASTAEELGDEPLLIHRRSRAPLAVAEKRGKAVQHLLSAHPELQLIVSDDGLQHHALARDLNLLVFDARGLGNGWLLPAGPLRQDRQHRALPGSSGGQIVLYSDGVRSTPMDGYLAHRHLGLAWPLADWWQRRRDGAIPVSELRGRTLLAAAGLAQPERYFAMLEAEGLTIDKLPLPDHSRLDPLPWPSNTPDVLVTEKDAVKIPTSAVPPGQRIWVLPLDLQASPEFEQALLAALTALLGPPPGHRHGSSTH